MVGKRKTKARRLQPLALSPRVMSERIMRMRAEFPTLDIDYIRQMVVEEHAERADTYNNRSEARVVSKLEGKKIAKRIAKKGNKKSVKKVLTDQDDRQKIAFGGKVYEIKKGLGHKFWYHFTRGGNWKDYVIMSKEPLEVTAIKKAIVKKKEGKRPTFDPWDKLDATSGPKLSERSDSIHYTKHNDKMILDHKGRKIKGMVVIPGKIKKLKIKDQMDFTGGSVYGSRTKRLHQKKIIPGPIGYLPILAALFNEIRMGQEKKKKNG